MKNISKIFKIKIKNTTLAVTLDSSYIAENIYKKESYEPTLSGKHYHAWYELFIVGAEPITLHTENSQREYSNCVLLVPPFFKHYTVRNSDYRITFSFKGEGEDGIHLQQPVALNCGQSILEYAQKIEKSFFNMGEYSNEITESFLKLIFCEIAVMNSGGDKKEYIAADESYLEKIEKLLYDFRADINLGFVAAELGLSTKQVSRIIRKNYNSTLSDLLMERRLNAAAELLKNTDMTVAEITESVNFPSESYFYSKFKIFYGKTPLKYRKCR